MAYDKKNIDGENFVLIPENTFEEIKTNLLILDEIKKSLKS